MNSGKWYWENEVVEATAKQPLALLMSILIRILVQQMHITGCIIQQLGKYILMDLHLLNGATFNTNGTIIGVAFDRDNLTLEFYKNGVSQRKTHKDLWFN